MDDSQKRDPRVCQITQANNNDESKCPWRINSEKHDNCFWAYVRDKSSPDGSMKELSQVDIANLMGWSHTKTHFLIKEATAELIEVLNKTGAHNLIDDLDSNLNEILIKHESE